MRDEYLDISVPIREGMLLWPGDPGVSIERREHVTSDATVLGARLSLGSHTGTHVDAPTHFSVGETTVDELPLSTLIGPAQVVDLRGVTEIGREELEHAGIGSAPRALLKTDNSRWVGSGPMPERPAHVVESGARYLIEKGIILVGIDGLSVDLPGRHEAHLVLLKAGVVLVETLDLSRVEAGVYDLVCLPLRIAGGEAGPARAVVRRR